jgi:hypothetical protein
MPVTNVNMPGRLRQEMPAPEHHGKTDHHGTPDLSARTEQLLYAFSTAITAVNDRPGLKSVIKKFFREHFRIFEYIITIRNDDPGTYGHFLHDLPGKAPNDEGFRIITGPCMPVRGSMT